MKALSMGGPPPAKAKSAKAKGAPGLVIKPHVPKPPNAAKQATNVMSRLMQTIGECNRLMATLQLHDWAQGILATLQQHLAGMQAHMNNLQNVLSSAAPAATMLQQIVPASIASIDGALVDFARARLLLDPTAGKAKSKAKSKPKGALMPPAPPSPQDVD